MMKRVIVLLSLVALLMASLAGLTPPVRAQDDTWTCDDGPNDALNAAQAAYDAGDLDRAHELALVAEEVCATNIARLTQALNLRSRIEAEMRPTPTLVPGDWITLTIENRSEDTICSLYVSPSDSESWGNNWLASQEAIAPATSRQWQIEPGSYDIGLGACNGDVLHEQYRAYLLQSFAFVYTAPHRDDYARDLNERGLEAYSSGRYAEALELFEEAIAIWRQIAARRDEAVSLSNLGLVYSGLGQLKQAHDLYTQSLAIAREVGDRAGEGTALNNIGGVYRVQGQYTQALDYYTQALAIHREVRNRPTEAVTLNNMGAVYHAQGQYATALDSFFQAMAIHRAEGNRIGEGTVFNNIGEVYRVQGQYVAALEMYAQALAIAQEVNNRPGEGTTLNNMGVIYHNQHQFAAALDAYQQALVIHQEVGDRAGAGITYNNIGEVYREQREYPAALDAYNRALVIHRQVGNRPLEATTLSNIGLVYQYQQQYAVALDAYNQALPIRREVQDIIGEITTLGNRAQVFEHIDQPEDAIADFAAAVDLIEMLAGGAVLDESISGLLSQWEHSHPYEGLALLLVRQSDLPAALDYAERGRAVLARTELSTGSIDFRAGLDESLLARETELRLVLDSAQNYLDSLRRDASATQDDIAAAEDALRAARRAYDQHITQMQLQGGYLAREIARDAAPLDTIQAALPPDSTLVLYSISLDFGSLKQPLKRNRGLF